jgi:hypothetical protein
MSGNVLVSFRLDRERPIQVRWLATDGTPGAGYKPQIVAIILPGTPGGRLVMDPSAIVETATLDPDRVDHYLVAFSGMVGYPEGHRDRELVDALTEAEVRYELAFVRDDGTTATAGAQYQLVAEPPAHARRLGGA